MARLAALIEAEFEGLCKLFVIRKQFGWQTRRASACVQLSLGAKWMTHMERH